MCRLSLDSTANLFPQSLHRNPFSCPCCAALWLIRAFWSQNTLPQESQTARLLRLFPSCSLTWLEQGKFLGINSKNVNSEKLKGLCFSTFQIFLQSELAVCIVLPDVRILERKLFSTVGTEELLTAVRALPVVRDLVGVEDLATLQADQPVWVVCIEEVFVQLG